MYSHVFCIAITDHDQLKAKKTKAKERKRNLVFYMIVGKGVARGNMHLVSYKSKAIYVCITAGNKKNPHMSQSKVSFSKGMDDKSWS